MTDMWFSLNQFFFFKATRFSVKSAQQINNIWCLKVSINTKGKLLNLKVIFKKTNSLLVSVNSIILFFLALVLPCCGWTESLCCFVFSVCYSMTCALPFFFFLLSPWQQWLPWHFIYQHKGTIMWYIWFFYLLKPFWFVHWKQTLLLSELFHLIHNTWSLQWKYQLWLKLNKWQK